MIPDPTYRISYFAKSAAFPSIFGPFGTAASRKKSSISPAGVNVISSRQSEHPGAPLLRIKRRRPAPTP